MNERSWLISGAVDELPPFQTELVTNTLEGLYRAELSGVIDTLVERVLGPTDGPDGDARERRVIDEHGRLRPFVELLLYELAWVAHAEGWTVAMRELRALDAIALAGF
jgi:hypothetical protein